MSALHVLEGDCRQILPTLQPRSVDCCVTSPPYFGLRNYGVEGQLGQERTPEEYVANMVAAFRHVWRVLMDQGTLWLNVGDNYADEQLSAKRKQSIFKPKDLLGIPWRLAFALQADGWYLRSDIIWHKPNPKPEGTVCDRPTKSHEYVFLLTKRERYYYDVDELREPVTSTGGACFGKQRHDTTGTGAQSRRLKSAAGRNHPLGKNKRSVWTIPVYSYHGAHFAVFPPDLVRPCILAGCPKRGMVLDPFAGSGTVGVVARELGRDATLIELNPAYVEMQRTRLGLQAVLGEPSADPSPKAKGSSAQPAEGRSERKPGLLWDDL